MKNHCNSLSMLSPFNQIRSKKKLKNLKQAAMNLLLLIWTIFNLCSMWTKSPANEIELLQFLLNNERNIFGWVG